MFLGGISCSYNVEKYYWGRICATISGNTLVVLVRVVDTITARLRLTKSYVEKRGHRSQQHEP